MLDDLLKMSYYLLRFQLMCLLWYIVVILLFYLIYHTKLLGGNQQIVWYAIKSPIYTDANNKTVGDVRLICCIRIYGHRIKINGKVRVKHTNVSRPHNIRNVNWEITLSEWRTFAFEINASLPGAFAFSNTNRDNFVGKNPRAKIIRNEKT